MSRRFGALSLIGPERPLLLARYVAHQAGRRARLRAMPLTYGRLIARSPARALALKSLPLPAVLGLPPELQRAAEEIRREADAVLDHRFRILSIDETNLARQLDWHRDFKSGYIWPCDFYLDVVATRLDDASDAKVPWELSRGHQLVALARAGTLFREERYAIELEEQLEQWIDQNPTGYGINWLTSMEIGIRAINWIWALRTLESWRPLSAPLRQRVAASLGCHGRHLAANLEGTPFLRSNHYLGDILGLLVIGSVLSGEEPAARRWFRFAHRAFEREARHQILCDGLGFEASLAYHGLVLEMFLLAAHIAHAAGRPFNPGTLRRIAGMADASLDLRHPNGRIPNFGDNDSGRILPASSRRGLTHDHLGWLATAILGSPRPADAEPHPEVAWTLGVPAWCAAGTAEPPSVTATTRNFSAGGVYIMRTSTAYAAVRFGRVGQNGNGGHAHNDVLSFEASFLGIPFVVDRGTPCYTSDPPLRNLARATASHSTVAITGLEQRPIDPARLFQLEEFGRHAVHHFSQTDSGAEFAATYSYDSEPVTHRRTFSLKGGRFTVSDHVVGVPPERITSMLHFAPGASVHQRSARSLIVRLESVEVALTVHGSVAEIAVTEGWIADNFGSRSPASVAAIIAAGSDFGYTLSVAETA